ncbi:nicotinate-nucleotide adenylyltransferase [Candidatus Synechococcus spongiarum]|uniref:Nicotinate-nucleotide adenylyltransferase n=1 Tax=Candidatus Synechococcus spongiarum TaxID=431041 RepID=A0A165AG09_9SYNE|nr:nicotinate-nucleotide adenylyltransferase [Candidatus Synechococcus spongiarum]SAY38988.1 Nicotinate-nucleotide adenylyltransferase (EC 2.7.7.18) [Candidatus Synechococcus spongiarum]
MSSRLPAAAMALFGTSADPPTIGHQAILAGLGQRYPMVATWASDNPLKRHGAPLVVRRQLLQAVVDGLKARMPQGRRLELRQDFSSRRALDSVQAARTCCPTARLLFVVGVDLLPQISNWYRASELLRCCCLAVVPRHNWPRQEQAMARLQASGAQLEVLPLRIPPVASSQVRQRPDPALVPKEVLPMLVSRNLYGFTGHGARQSPKGT